MSPVKTQRSILFNLMPECLMRWWFFLEMRVQTGLSNHPSGLQTAHRATAQWFHAIENTKKGTVRTVFYCILCVYIYWIKQTTVLDLKSVDTLVSTTMNIKKKMYMSEVMSTAISSYCHSVIFKSCRYFVFLCVDLTLFLYSSEAGCLELFGWWHIFMRVMNAG